MTSNIVAALLDPLMPAQELRLHMGEMSAQELRTARAAIAWSNSKAATLIEAQAEVIASLSKALEPFSVMGDEMDWLSEDNDRTAWGFDDAHLTFGDFKTARAALTAAKTHLEK